MRRLGTRVPRLEHSAVDEGVVSDPSALVASADPMKVMLGKDESEGEQKRK